MIEDFAEEQRRKYNLPADSSSTASKFPAWQRSTADSAFLRLSQVISPTLASEW